VGVPLSSPPRENDLNFQVKNARFYAFVGLQKLLVAKNRNWGAYLTRWGLEM